MLVKNVLFAATFKDNEQVLTPFGRQQLCKSNLAWIAYCILLLYILGISPAFY